MGDMYLINAVYSINPIKLTEWKHNSIDRFYKKPDFLFIQINRDILKYWSELAI